MTDIPVRELALDALMEILEEGRFCHIVIGRTLDKYAYLPRQDRAFLKRVTEGTVEYRIRADYILGLYSSVKVSRMKPLIRTLLRMSVYQIFEMDRVPDSAVCNEAVKLAKKRGFRGLAGFVNGILRNISRNKDTITWPDDEIRYSMPAWLIDRWSREYGRETCLRMLEAFAGESRVTVRINSGKKAREEVLHLLEQDGASLIPLYPENGVYILDYSGAPDNLTAFREGDLVLDVCGAPGGKALHAAEIMHGTGQVIVRDLSEEKVERIRENIARSGYENVRAEVFDAREFDPDLEGKCDIVIADLPCSGLGVIGRKPDIRYHASEEGIASLAALQREILPVVCRYVKPGGTLVYSTCTTTGEENIDNFRWLVKESGFLPVDITERFPEGLRKETMKEGYVQLLPGTDPCDGFFISVLSRKE